MTTKVDISYSGKINAMKKLLNHTKTIVLLLLLLLLPVTGFSENHFYNKINELAEQLLETKKGSILSIDEDMLYIDKGQKDDIASGNKFDIIRFGEPLMEKNTVTGFKETKIGEVEIENVRKNFSLGRVLNKTKAIEKSDKLFRQSLQMDRVAIDEFDSAQGETLFAREVVRILSNCFIKKGINVVCSEKIESIKSKSLSSSKRHADCETYALMGQLLGVDGVVTGDIVNIGSSVVINVRILEINQGNAVSAARVELQKDSQLSFFFNKFDKTSRMDKKLPGKSKSVSATFTFGKPLREGKYFESPDVCVSVTSMEKSLRNIHVNLVYENLRNYNISLKIKELKSIYLVDENNQRWNFKTDTVGIYKWGKSILRNTALNTRLIFTPAGDTNGTVFSLYMAYKRPSDFNLIIHNIHPAKIFEK